MSAEPHQYAPGVDSTPGVVFAVERLDRTGHGKHLSIMASAEDSPDGRVLAVVPDLFFATKIAATARLGAVRLELVTLAGAFEACSADPPRLLLLDLHAPGDPIALVRALKADARTAPIPVLGFFSHVEIERRTAALDAGIDAAMPRSAFVTRLPSLLEHGIRG